MHTQENALRRPTLPSSYHQPSAIASTLLVFYALALFILPALLARAVLLVDGLPLPVAVLLMSPLIWLAGQGLLLIGWVGHEGVAHFSLYRNKWMSVLIGLFVSAAIPTYLEMGFAVPHRNHHRFTNQASDPDCKIFSQFKNVWTKILFARLLVDTQYLKNVFTMAFNRQLPYSYIFPFKGKALVALSWINIWFSSLWLASYIFITLKDPITGLVSIGLPFLVMVAISSIQPYLEHSGTKVGIGRDARSRTSPLFTLLYCGNNYHLEHHLYPSVPCYKLPAVHRLLEAQDFYKLADSSIDPTIAGVYIKGATLPYPNPGQEDSSYDPLIADVS